MTHERDSEVTAPHQSYGWLRPFLPKRFQPYLRGLRKRWQLRNLTLDEPFRSVAPYTQVAMNRQRHLLGLAEQVDAAGLVGAVVECGVLDGGVAALMAFGTRASGRQVHLFDAWQGLPDTSDEDGQASKKWVGQVVGSPRRVVAVMKRLGIDRQRVHFHVGWFHETFPRADVSGVALLHIDCDFYEPTRLCLETWYPKLVEGGYVQIDDYESFSGCRKAVDEFLTQHPELSLETAGSNGTAYFLMKPRAPENMPV